jgi:hypothetical protein
MNPRFFSGTAVEGDVARAMDSGHAATAAPRS